MTPRPSTKFSCTKYRTLESSVLIYRVKAGVEDIVVSGGDVYQLKPAQITAIGERLLDMKYVRRIRFATKGPAVMPQKVLTDLPWRDALTRIVDKGRKLRKEVALHTHFNHPNEITAITEEAMGQLMERELP